MFKVVKDILQAREHSVVFSFLIEMALLRYNKNCTVFASEIKVIVMKILA